MIKFVYGDKGSGKTKKMIDMANEALETCDGNIVFINDRDKYQIKVDTKIRFTDLDEFEVTGIDQLSGFISGVISENYDVKLIFIDNLLRILEAKDVKDVCLMIEKIKRIQKDHDIKFVLSISCDKEELPECITELM